MLEYSRIFSKNHPQNRFEAWAYLMCLVFELSLRSFLLFEAKFVGAVLSIRLMLFGKLVASAAVEASC